MILPVCKEGDILTFFLLRPPRAISTKKMEAIVNSSWFSYLSCVKKSSEAYKAGYKTIADIERTNFIINKIKDEQNSAQGNFLEQDQPAS